MKDFIKFIPGSIIILLGITMLIVGLNTEQNSWYLTGSGAIILAGIISILNALDIVSNVVKYTSLVILTGFAAYLAYLDYRSIKDPIDFMKEREKRSKYVIQGLKDIRAAELAYKSQKGVYTGSLDTLVNFVKYDSLLVIKAFGTVPDTLTEEKAVELGIVRRDTVFIPVQDSIFSKYQQKDRVFPFVADSLPYIPFSGGEKYILKADFIEQGRVKVSVFEAVAPKELYLKGLEEYGNLIRQSKDLKVGSLDSPSTAGNWE
ncbi:MAG: hypothetical protein D6707_00225 [Bacteroidetes bacterium]|nr:MAG: hypothetical protein D6707_00225 [Bacteroidota bacterium]